MCCRCHRAGMSSSMFVCLWGTKGGEHNEKDRTMDKKGTEGKGRRQVRGGGGGGGVLGGSEGRKVRGLDHLACSCWLAESTGPSHRSSRDRHREVLHCSTVHGRRSSRSRAVAADDGAAARGKSEILCSCRSCRCTGCAQAVVNPIVGCIRVRAAGNFRV